MARHVLRTLLIVLILSVPAAAHPPRGGKPMVPATPDLKDESHRLLQKSMKRLGEIQALLERQGKLPPEVRDDLVRELKDLALDLKTVQINLRELVPQELCVPEPGVPLVVPVMVEPPPPPEPAGPLAMEPGTFETLLEEIDGQSFSDDKLMVLRSAAREAFFSTAQVKALLGGFVHSSDKLDLLRAVAGRIVDRENIFTIYGALVHSSDKEEARRILEGR